MKRGAYLCAAAHIRARAPTVTMIGDPSAHDESAARTRRIGKLGALVFNDHVASACTRLLRRMHRAPTAGFAAIAAIARAANARMS
ncbi:hypothetical protein BTO02_28290 [Paraburkholderia sp. SOS3]|nr:hypothetical protein BTO02_28290 [Paraburkholderia sp. SOS3]